MNDTPFLRTLGPFATVSVALLLGACSAAAPTPTGADASGAFLDCQDEALAMDASAAAGGGVVQYRQAARLGQLCLSEPGASTGAVRTDAMRLSLVVALDYLRAGDLGEARAALDRFDAAFPGRDLRLDDHSSLRETLGVLLAGAERGALAAGSNINPTLLAELRRLDRWADR